MVDVALADRRNRHNRQHVGSAELAVDDRAVAEGGSPPGDIP
jgi:hypothetical protein